MSVATLRNLTSVLRRHFPGVIACCAAVIVSVMWMWGAQDTLTVTVFAGWRQSIIVFGLGLVLAGAAAELTALAAASSPGETPADSIVIALIFALPFYGVMILLGIAARD